jgi:cytochrome P450
MTAHEPRPSRTVSRRFGDHAAVVAVATDPETFSSAVSRHLQVPNGLDGEAHRRARAMLDPFLDAQRVAAYTPAFVRVAQQLLEQLAGRAAFDAVSELGARYAVRAQSAWLGWPASIEDDLLQWVADNRAATRSGDRTRLAGVAVRFDAIVRARVEERMGADAPDDLTTELVRTRDAEGMPLSQEVLVSVLRNWTGGDLASLALCVGVVVAWLTEHPEHAERLAAADDAELDAVLDEILRLDDPFLANRRIATRATEVAGCPVAHEEVVALDWREANVDPARFEHPHAFDPHGNASANLVWGIGPHVCPGRPLATLQLRVLTRELLRTGSVRAAEEHGGIERETPPAGGYRRFMAALERHEA